MPDEAPTDVDVSDDALQKFLGTSSFGKQSAKGNGRAVAAKERIKEDDSDDDDDNRDEAGSVPDSNDSDDSDDSDDDEPEYPISQSLKIATHERAVTTLTLDPSGARLISGSLDASIKLHDLASLTPTTIRAFKSVDPSNPRPTAANTAESHPIHHVQFNPLSPSSLLVIDATPQAKVLDRDGAVISEYQKGDMYLRDMNNTKGHVSEITSGTWHPTWKESFVTAATDSTLRIWDVDKPRQQREVIVFKSRVAGNAGRSRMTAVAWGASTGEGSQNVLLSTALDGTLVMYAGEGPYARPAAEIRKAHEPGTWTSGIDLSPDGRMVVTRGGDNLIKLWDLRKLKTAVNSISHESTSDQYPTSNIRFSPGGSHIITGSASGDLHILNAGSLRSEATVPVTPGKPLITVLWHAKLNQIVTGSADASTHILYDQSISTGGAKAIALRAPKRRHIDDDPSLTTDLSAGVNPDAIILPGGAHPSAAGASSFASRHPNVGLTASGKSRDPRRPHQPAVTPFAKNNPDQGYVRSQIPLSSMRDEDPREALLKYAAKEGERMFTGAWAETQPVTRYAELSDDDEEDAGGGDAKRQKR